jgi:hypothetical protein
VKITPKMLHALRAISKGGYWEDRAAGYVRYMSIRGPCAIHGNTILGLTRRGLIRERPGTWEIEVTEKGRAVLGEGGPE